MKHSYKTALNESLKHIILMREHYFSKSQRAETPQDKTLANEKYSIYSELVEQIRDISKRNGVKL